MTTTIKIIVTDSIRMFCVANMIDDMSQPEAIATSMPIVRNLVSRLWLRVVFSILRSDDCSWSNGDTLWYFGLQRCLIASLMS